MLPPSWFCPTNQDSRGTRVHQLRGHLTQSTHTSIQLRSRAPPPPCVQGHTWRGEGREKTSFREGTALFGAWISRWLSFPFQNVEIISRIGKWRVGAGSRAIFAGTQREGTPERGSAGTAPGQRWGMVPGGESQGRPGRLLFPFPVNTAVSSWHPGAGGCRKKQRI